MKKNIFKRGDVIVSGYGNIRIFTGEVYDGDSWKCLAPYCESDCPAGTDMRYARLATKAEAKKFFTALKKNGFVFNKKTLVIEDSGTYTVDKTYNACVRWEKKDPVPYKVVEKRVRATLGQVRALEKENSELKDSVAKLNEKLKELTAKCKDQLKADEYLAKQVDDLKGKLSDTQKSLKRANGDYSRLSEEYKELHRKQVLTEKDLSCVQHANKLLGEFNEQYKKRIERLEGRGFWERVFNKDF